MPLKFSGKRFRELTDEDIAGCTFEELFGEYFFELISVVATKTVQFETMIGGDEYAASFTPQDITDFINQQADYLAQRIIKTAKTNDLTVAYYQTMRERIDRIHAIKAAESQSQSQQATKH